ncbi:30S ribosomal protein S8 [archaeon]|nr:30S ribosomal protein S8 [archaeon]
MSLNDPLANVFSQIMNYEKIGKNECVVKPTSKFIVNVLKIMKDNKYIGDYKVVEDGRGGYLHINLIGAINKCGVIKPRLSFKKENLEKFEKRHLPAKDFGILIVSTNKGLMTHIECVKNNIGGKLVAYIY